MHAARGARVGPGSAVPAVSTVARGGARWRAVARGGGRWRAEAQLEA
jgi:hypothetical protein